MILRIFGHDFHYECENLCRVYFPNEKINIVYDESGEDSRTVVTRCAPIDGGNLISVEAEIDGVSRSAQAEVRADENELRDKSELKTAQLIFALLPLVSVVLRAFFLSQITNPPSSASTRQKRRILYRSRVQSFKE